MPKHGIVWTLVSITSVIVVGLLVEALIILFNGHVVPRPTIPRRQTYGTGAPLSYVVLGDSTAVSQGSDYSAGFAVASAKRLALTHTVTLTNTAVSGARLADVARTQLPEAARQHPDIVLLAAGANDATHLTTGSSLAHSLQTIITGLRTSNPNVRIVVTGCPAMDSVSRFPIGAKQLMGLRTRQVNSVFAKVVSQQHLTWAPIARETRATFLADPTLFAADKFHPNARGYAVWIPVILRALDTVVRS